MLDFMKVSLRERSKKQGGGFALRPKFLCRRTKDLMIRGGDFYAIWDERNKKWSTDQHDAIRLIDQELYDYQKAHPEYLGYAIDTMEDYDSGVFDEWRKFVKKGLNDEYVLLDSSIVFLDAEPKRENYATKHLPYALCDMETPCYNRLSSVLYSEKELHKIEWAIGAILSGDSKTIQKFLVFYGAMGTGKSTILNIVQMLFEGYWSPFDAASLGSRSDSFALEQFKNNPLVAIQHDGDLSHIEDNTKLNSIVSHEKMTVNEKFKALYAASFSAMLFIGTNKPVRITDSKSGLLRRLIDVNPTGNRLSHKEYDKCMAGVPFELGGIAKHCLEVYLSDKEHYDKYVPVEMMAATNDLYNFVLDNVEKFASAEIVTLNSAWKLYKEYVEYANVKYTLSKRQFKDEFKTYFEEFKPREKIKGVDYYNFYRGFKQKRSPAEQMREEYEEETLEKAVAKKVDSTDEIPAWLKLEQWTESRGENVFNQLYSSCFAQYATEKGTPSRRWENVKTELGVLDTSRVHYVRMPQNHICIDFDLKDENGNKSLEKNLEAAAKFPKTYAEVSKGGGGLHLHYIYDGDATQLSAVYDDNIEIKVFTGNSSLRRRLSLCNTEKVSHISSGLPLKGAPNKVIDWSAVKNEKALRTMIKRSLNKEYLGSTKPEMDFIKKYVGDAYEAGTKYDLRDLRPTVMNFAANSTNNAQYCMELVEEIHWCSDDAIEDKPFGGKAYADDDSDIIFFDVEVFPNLFVVCWKQIDLGNRETVVKMINPSPADIEALCEKKLVGFNNRNYDNHILMARIMGYSNAELYELSQRLIGDSRNAGFRDAANLSYTDIYDFAATKQSLKKWEIALGIHHLELGLPWDQPVPEEMWETVADYCVNDVIATEAVFKKLAGDFAARKILAKIAGMTPNNTTNQLTTRIIFGSERHPQLVYTDLATGEMSDGGKAAAEISSFPGYEYQPSSITGGKPKNMFRGDDLGFGGWVFANPGYWRNVALIDVRSMHPWSAINLRYFGEYTKRFQELVEARGYVKLRDLEKARKVLDGALAPFLPDDVDKATLKELALALKIAINSVYGLTSAKFENPFRDSRNVNNIVALRGALFMRTLQDEVKKRGFTVAHIKTDSIKIPEATPEIIEFCLKFAEKYGYAFEHEATYERMCLVNDAVYVAKYMTADDCKERYGYVPGDNDEHGGEWTATGTQFQVPYVFKTLFSKEPIQFADLCETKSVTSTMYLDMDEPNVDSIAALEKEKKALESLSKRTAKKTGEPCDDRGILMREVQNYDYILKQLADMHDYKFVGRCGQFCPIVQGAGGGVLVRENHGKMDSVVGTKGFRWLESETVKILGKEGDIDRAYYRKLVDDAIEAIAEYVDPEVFVA